MNLDSSLILLREQIALFEKSYINNADIDKKGIYMFENINNGKKYIDLTKQSFRERFSGHTQQFINVYTRKCPDDQLLHARYLYEDIDNYFLKCFKVTILHIITDDDVASNKNIFEQKLKHYIEIGGTVYPNGYNLSNDGTIPNHVVEYMAQKWIQSISTQQTNRPSLLYININNRKSIIIYRHQYCEFREFTIITDGPKWPDVEKSAIEFYDNLDKNQTKYEVIVPTLTTSEIITYKKNIAFCRKYPGYNNICTVLFDEPIDNNCAIAEMFIKLLDANDQLLWKRCINEWQIKKFDKSPVSIPPQRFIIEQTPVITINEEKFTMLGFIKDFETKVNQSIINEFNTIEFEREKREVERQLDSIISEIKVSEDKGFAPQSQSLHLKVFNDLKYQCYNIAAYNTDPLHVHNPNITYETSMVYPEYITVWRSGVMTGAVILNHPLIAFKASSVFRQRKDGETDYERIAEGPKRSVEDCITEAENAIRKQLELDTELKIIKCVDGLPANVEYIKRSFAVIGIKNVKYFRGLIPSTLDRAIKYSIDANIEGTPAYIEMNAKPSRKKQ